MMGMVLPAIITYVLASIGMLAMYVSIVPMIACAWVALFLVACFIIVPVITAVWLARLIRNIFFRVRQ